jgi:putative spermidine/putrescine transport system ATP-binding protein
VAQFIGENNRIDGRIADQDGRFCLVDTPAGQVRALTVRTDGVGSFTSLSVRPERITLGKPGTLATDNRVRGHVLERIYHGDHHKVRLRLEGDSEFVLRIASTTELASDGLVELGWQAEHCRALDPLPAAPANSTTHQQEGTAA